MSLSPLFQWQGEDLILAVYLQPKAASDGWVAEHQGRIKIRLTAPPVDGKANAHLLRFLADEFAVPQKAVTLLSGQVARQKRVKIQSPQRIPADLRALIPGL